MGGIVRSASNRVKLAIGKIYPRYPYYLPGLRSTLKDAKKAMGTGESVRLELDFSKVVPDPLGVKYQGPLGLKVGNTILCEDIHQPVAQEMLRNFQRAMTITRGTTVSQIRKLLFHPVIDASRPDDYYRRQDAGFRFAVGRSVDFISEIIQGQLRWAVVVMALSAFSFINYFGAFIETMLVDYALFMAGAFKLSAAKLRYVSRKHFHDMAFLNISGMAIGNRRDDGSWEITQGVDPRDASTPRPNAPGSKRLQ